MLHADHGPSPSLNGHLMHIGIVCARFNYDVTHLLHNACVNELMTLQVAREHIHTLTVPGALEIPFALQTMAKQKKYHALIAIGCIIRGQTYHFELVSNESASGISRVSLDYDVPIANAILTVNNLAQAIDRQIEKGCDAARVAIEMALLSSLPSFSKK